ncbi:hypothetical protein THITH_06010 [Thioalkalivibrio paradoxus ARh 1]|uniref:DUF218 domain-containing protein n=1 Tax=Thioalkalivibrio paradoxus ARh 1 TaxID=713585 RepID=W0DGX5_9GAMM|nr:hypothetical protein THITH_06010 [Thioalkalivibrio paradoxus ARh 1]
MFDIIKPLVGAFAAPLALATLLVLLAALALWRGRRVLGRLLLVLGLLLVFLSSWAPVSNRLLAPLKWAYPPVWDPRDHGDVTAVVVLGAGWVSDLDVPASIRLSTSASVRLMEGLRLLEALPDARLLVSGASRDAERLPVALGYAQAAQALGIDPARIVALDTPVDTAQEAYAVRAVLADGERFFLVTSASHMRRAVRHFERAGLTPIPAPTGFKTGGGRVRTLAYWVPSADNLRKTERVVHEYLGWWALGLDHYRLVALDSGVFERAAAVAAHASYPPEDAGRPASGLRRGQRSALADPRSGTPGVSGVFRRRYVFRFQARVAFASRARSCP